jgi:hypothetical protein
LPRLFSRLGEDGKQDRGEDRYYRDHDEQLDQGERRASPKNQKTVMCGLA